MAASSTWDSGSVSNLAITSARCSGFAKIRGQNDYTFIIDLEWTDDRTLSVKRTYADFQQFHSELTKLFPELRNPEKSRLLLRRSSLRESMANLFNKDTRSLAESREPMIDSYLRNLLRQPERIRRCNSVLQFFESRDSDPKPCKTNSPSEKSDSGIDLTNDSSSRTVVDDNSAESLEHNVIPQSPINQDIDTDNYSSSDDEYEGDTSGTETDDGDFNEDYFLDFGFGELQLHNQGSREEVPNSPTTEGEGSMWCSNLDKFSNILRSSMSNLNTADIQNKHFTTMTSLDEGDGSQILEDLVHKSISDESEVDESSMTESQITQQLTDNEESDEEYDSKPLTKTNLKHYYLSTTNLNQVE